MNPNAPYDIELQTRDSRAVSTDLLLADISRKIFDKIALPQLLERICEEACHALGADHALAVKVDLDEFTRQKVIHSHRAPPEFKNAVESSAELPKILAELFRKGRPEITHGLVFAPDAPPQETGSQTICLIPLTINREPYGWLGLVHLSPREYFKEDLALAEALGELFSLAIQNSLRFREFEEKRTHSAALSEISSQIARGLDLSAVMDTLVASAAKILGGEAGVRVIEDDRLILVASTPAAKLTMKSDRIRLGESLEGRAASSGVSIIRSEAAFDPNISNAERDAIVPGSTGSWMIIPARSGGRILGSLHIFREQGHEFDSRAVELAGSLAGLAAIAIENDSLRRKYVQSESVYENIIDNSDDAFLIMDKEFTLTGWNQGAENLFGHTGKEVLGKSIKSIFPENKRYLETAQSVLSFGQPARLEDFFRSKFGFIVPTGVKFIPLKDEEGNINAISAMHKDLTEQKRTESDLILRDRALDTTAHGILITDPSLPNAPIIYANESFEKITGYSISEIFGKSLRFLLGDDTDQPGVEEIWKAFEGNQPGHAVVRNYRQDGSMFWNEIHIVPFRDEIGTITHHITVMRDITEQKESADKLRLTKEAAESASRAKDEFLASISRELHIPLNAMSALAETLLLQPDEENTRRIAGTIRDTSSCLSHMIEQIIDFDRIESGRANLKRNDVLLSDLIMLAIGEKEPALPEEISIRTEFDSDFDLISCDPDRIRQVLGNLLDNAVKYSPDGGVITVRTKSHQGDIHVSIEDEGIGIDPLNTKAIFDRYSQVESGEGAQNSGLGIGLNISRSIIELHGGRIRVKSEIGKGSTFTFSLPQSVDARSSTSRPAGNAPAALEDEVPWPPRSAWPGSAPSLKSEDAGDRSDSAPWSGRTILVVDDDTVFHEYIELLMSSAARVLPARDGKIGVEVARRTLPDLIFMDLRMPVLDGFSAVKALKDNPATSHIPIIAVTAHGVEEIRARAMSAGSSGIINKPVDTALLTEEVQRLLGQVAR